jgi:hypothetical protein
MRHKFQRIEHVPEPPHEHISFSGPIGMKVPEDIGIIPNRNGALTY